MLANEIRIWSSGFAGTLATALGNTAMALLRLLRGSLFTVLLLFEPLVRVVLTVCAVLGIMLSFFFRLSGAAPQYPFALMIALSMGSLGAVVVYHAILRLLAR